MIPRRPMHPQIAMRTMGQAGPAPAGPPPLAQQQQPVPPFQPPQVQRPVVAPQSPPMASRGDAMASAEQARMSMDPGIGALTVPPSGVQEMAGYAATALPFMGAALFATPLAPVAAAFGVASLAEQYVSNKERQRNPSRFPAEWEKFTPDAQTAWIAQNDPALKQEMLDLASTTGKEPTNADILSYRQLKAEMPDLTFRDYLENYKFKADALPSDVRAAIWDSTNGGALMRYFLQSEASKTTGSEEAKYLTARNDYVIDLQNKILPELESAYDDTEQLLKMIEGGQFSAAMPILGGVLARFDTELANLNARATYQALVNLGITNLAPVTEKEIEMIRGLFADVNRDPKANIGTLQAALKRLEGMIRLSRAPVDYFQQEGSMKGYVAPRRMLSFDKAEAAAQTPAAAPAAAPVPGAAPALNPDEDPDLERVQ